MVPGYNRLYNEYMNKTTNDPTWAVDIKSAGLHRSWVKDTYLHIYELSNSSFNLEKKIIQILILYSLFHFRERRQSPAELPEVVKSVCIVWVLWEIINI